MKYSRKEIEDMKPMERDAYLRTLFQRIAVLRHKLRVSRESFVVSEIQVDESYVRTSIPILTPQPRLELSLGGGQRWDDLSVEIDMVLDELQDLLKTVNDICGESLQTVQRRLLQELQKVGI